VKDEEGSSVIDELQRLNERLARAAEQQARLQKQQGLVAQIEAELRQAEKQTRDLKLQVTREDADVERLEGVSLTGVFYSILGSKDEQLYRERQEALAAHLKYDEALKQVASLQRELEQARGGLGEASQGSESYEALLKEKEALVARSPGNGAAQLLRLGEQQQEARWQLQQLEEARTAGHNADAALRQVADSLQSAQNWGTWDLLGGGMIATAVKHSRIDDARSQAHYAQQALAAFQRELKDVAMMISVGEIGIDGFTRFADYFFDGLIMDWVVQSRINDSLNGVRQAQNQVSSLLRMVESHLHEVQARERALELERQAFIAQFQG
jgi:uncharacterized phage infection (PIP) family protein YhgE